MRIENQVVLVFLGHSSSYFAQSEIKFAFVRSNFHFTTTPDSTPTASTFLPRAKSGTLSEAYKQSKSPFFRKWSTKILQCLPKWRMQIVHCNKIPQYAQEKNWVINGCLLTTSEKCRLRLIYLDYASMCWLPLNRSVISIQNETRYGIH